jgi:pseudouridine synthase
LSVRLQKVLAAAGIASRRAAERLMLEGRVEVNGRVVREMGVRVDPEGDAIRVDGKRIVIRPTAPTYWALHKPRGVVTTLSDPEGRPTVKDLLPRLRSRLFPVGRLDYDSEGLLLLTDDGALARDLMHPRSAVSKTYLAKVRGRPAAEALARLESGIVLDGRKTRPARVRIARDAPNAWVEIRIVEGRNRQVRRMLEAVGHPVQRLRRTGYAGVLLGSLAPGESRRLTAPEVERLRRAVEPASSPPARRGGNPR